MRPLQGNRWYYFDENMVCLTDENVTILKSMGTRKNLDSKFVSVLLSAVFGDDVLKESSAGGHKSNFNNVSHPALDSKKLKFVKGNVWF